jgi:hypothetical protein
VVGRSGEVGGGSEGGGRWGREEVKKKKHLGQGGCSSAKRAERAHPQLVH